MTRRARALCGVALLPLCLMVGCGGSDSGSGSGSGSGSDRAASKSTTLDAAFIDKAETVCAPYAKYNAKHFLDLPGFSRFAPDRHVLPRVAAYVSRNPAYRTLVTDLQALGTPAGGTAAWGVVMHDFDANTRLVKSEIRSAHASDDAGFVSNETRLEASIATLQVDLLKLGLSGGSPCYGAQLDPLAGAHPTG